MSENFEQTLATVENYFSLIFGVLVGNTKLTIVMQFVFRENAATVGKLEKYISHVLGLKTAKIKGEFTSYQNITLVQKQTKLENVCPMILIWEMFHISSDMGSSSCRQLKMETNEFQDANFAR